jgi:hypothetical protein
VKIFKFMIGREPVDLPQDPANPNTSLQVADIMAIALAETEQQARQIVLEDDWDSRWLAVAQVRVIELDKAKLVAYAGSYPVAKKVAP